MLNSRYGLTPPILLLFFLAPLLNTGYIVGKTLYAIKRYRIITIYSTFY